MNSWMKKGYIELMVCGDNLAYVIQDDSFFSATEYKVLHGQDFNGYVKCMQMLYNGRPQLYYFTNAKKTFNELYGNLSEENRKVVLRNLLKTVLRVKQNGFLSCQNIDISLEHVYVDTNNYEVSFIYLPLNIPIFENYNQFENVLRTQLVQLMESTEIHLEILNEFKQGLSNETVLLERLVGGLEKSCATKKVMHMVLRESPDVVDLCINKEEFLIGKKAELCDGVIGFNKMISRLHCKINVTGEMYTITDLQSANGTYVNGMRIVPNEPRAIYSGDIIRLANSEFEMRMEDV